MRPAYNVLYNGNDYAAEFDGAIVGVTYNFAQFGRADDISITIEDSQKRLIDDMYPEKGDVIELDIGYSIPVKMLCCGEFEIDEPEFDLYEQTVTVKGTSTAIKQSLNEKNYRTYENKSLKSIIKAVADRNGLSVKGTVDNISIVQKTQSNSDLEFLHELAELFGYVFKIEGDDLIFHKYGELEKADAEFEIDMCDLMSGSRVGDSTRRYQFCELRYSRHGDTLVEKVEDPSVKNGITLKIEERCENKGQATAIAAASLFRANRDSVSGTLVFPLEIAVAAGSVIVLKNAGKLSGRYCVLSGTTEIHGGESPATTTVEVYKV